MGKRERWSEAGRDRVVRGLSWFGFEDVLCELVGLNEKDRETKARDQEPSELPREAIYGILGLG